MDVAITTTLTIKEVDSGIILAGKKREYGLFKTPAL